MNSVNLIARLGADPQLRWTPNGKAVCTFSVADSEKYKDASGETHERTTWVDLEAWGRTAEVINEHFRKGQRIAIVGSLRQDVWTDKEGQKRSRLKVVVNSFDFIEPRNDRDAAPSQPRQQDDRQPARAAGTRQGAGTQADDDDSGVPF